MGCKLRFLVTLCGGITSTAYLWSQNKRISSKMKLFAEEENNTQEKLKVLIIGMVIWVVEF